mmetsp:Transcript_97530/g.271346  ORF Transcript_97530/g.271346 Transcript_97530/m.271346 type:complete len:412 (+) Transcript_97530:535-1770(+)
MPWREIRSPVSTPKFMRINCTSGFCMRSSKSSLRMCRSSFLSWTSRISSRLPRKYAHAARSFSRWETPQTTSQRIPTSMLRSVKLLRKTNNMKRKVKIHDTLISCIISETASRKVPCNNNVNMDSTSVGKLSISGKDLECSLKIIPNRYTRMKSITAVMATERSASEMPLSIVRISGAKRKRRATLVSRVSRSSFMKRRMVSSPKAAALVSSPLMRNTGSITKFSPTIMATKNVSKQNQLSSRHSRRGSKARNRTINSAMKAMLKKCSTTWKPGSACQIVGALLKLASTPNHNEFRMITTRVHIKKAPCWEILAHFFWHVEPAWISLGCSWTSSIDAPVLWWNWLKFIRYLLPVSSEQATSPNFRPIHSHHVSRRVLRILLVFLVMGSYWIMSTKNSSMGVCFILPVFSRT